MSQANVFNKDLFGIVASGLVALFLVPAIAYGFVRYAIPELDGKILASIERNIDDEKRLTAVERDQRKAFFRALPPSHVCNDPAPDVVRYREGVCARYSTMWQFDVAKKTSGWALVAGVVVLFAIMGLGALAFVNRHMEYLSFLAGWRLLILASAAAVIVQGALLVWLSFWLTAFFFTVYAVKLIAIVAIGAALAVFYAVYSLFKRPPRDTGIDGETVAESEAPALWAHIRDMAVRAETAPPQQIVAGIDTNFFVTEAPLATAHKSLHGRTLFVSLPLLRVLDRAEADAVLAHELAHFSGGDTAYSAALGPKLVQYDQYSAMMHAGGVTRFAYYLLRLYRVIFEFAHKRDSREREFVADRVAAKLVSARAIVTALIKVGAYARYRGETEQALFEHTSQHTGAIGIAERVAAGLAPYAASSRFLQAMQQSEIPHPFDSHPPLTERMQNVGQTVPEHEYSTIVSAPPQATWITDIAPAATIEQGLWARYESQFAAAHEHHLAYRYLPANDEERAVVLRYFPPQEFTLRGGRRIGIAYDGMTLPEQSATMSWDSVANLGYEDGIGGDVLKITHPEKGWLGPKTTSVKLPGIGKQRGNLKAALGAYWQRHQVMRAGGG